MLVPPPGVIPHLVLDHHMVPQVEWGVLLDLVRKVFLILGGPLGQGELPPLGHLLPSAGQVPVTANVWWLVMFGWQEIPQLPAEEIILCPGQACFCTEGQLW